MPVPSFSGFKVYLRFYPHGSTEIMFNGEYLNNLNVYAILEDYTAGGFTPVITCLGFLEPSETGVMSLGASYLDNNSFSVKYYTSEYWDFTAIFQTEFSAYLYSSQIETVFIVEPTVLDFFGVIGSGGSSSTVDLTPLTTLIEGINTKIDLIGTTPSNNSFNFLDLNGNCGTFKNDTVVNVSNKEGDFIVRSSQIFWNDITSNSNMIIYYLEQDGCFMYSPDCYVVKKKVL